MASKLQLGLVYHLSRETEAAMWKYSSLVKSLDKVPQLEFYDVGVPA